MAEQKVGLRKVRDLSENLNDTFAFIRQNFKPLVTSFLAIAGVFMLANSILNGLYQSQVGGSMFKNVFGRNRTTITTPFYMFTPTYFIVIALAWLNFIAMSSVVTCYMKLYDRQSGEAPTIETVWAEFRKCFLKVAVFNIPVVILICIGFAFCLVPGIYLGVVLTPFSIALIVEEQTFGEAWSRCFAIIKNNFWSSLGIYLLVYIIYAFSAGIISGIFGLLTGLISYFTTRDISTTIGITTSVLNIFSFVFYIVFWVSVCLHYFSLSEKYDSTGLKRRLDNLGQTGNDFNNVQEQY